MSWTKEQFVLKALSKIGYASYDFDLQPEDKNDVLYDLDSMMAQWSGKGIRLGYPIPSTPEDSSLDTETEVPSYAVEGIWSNLVIRIAPDKGKVVSPEIKAIAREAYNTFLTRAVKPNEMQLPGTMPRGAGQKAWRNNQDPFIDSPVDNLATGNDDILNVRAN